MSDAPAAESVDFEQAQFDSPDQGVLSCEACRKALDAPYFSVNGKSVCASCLEGLRAGLQGSFFKALGQGAAAGALGAAVYFGIRAKWEYDLAIITFVLGIMVGIAVRRGAGGSPHWVYRAMAIGLAWLAMCSTYVPQLAEAAGERQGPLVWILMTVLSMFVPFFMIQQAEVLGIIIFGIGLWAAWRNSAPPPFVVAGPFEPVPAPVPQANPQLTTGAG